VEGTIRSDSDSSEGEGLKVDGLTNGGKESLTVSVEKRQIESR
jgi:hypothetical protein